MVINNVKIQYNGEFLLDIILLVLCYYYLPLGNPIKCHGEFLSLLRSPVNLFLFNMFPPSDRVDALNI